MVIVTHSFWTEGPGRLREALHGRRVELDQLLERIRSETDADERARLERKLRRLIEEYTPSADELDQCLFLFR